MPDLFAERILGVPWVLLAIVALAIAGIYASTEDGSGADGARWLVLRWAHSICWLLLATAALAMTKLTPIPPDWAMRIAAMAGLLYLAFLATKLTI